MFEIMKRHQTIAILGSEPLSHEKKTVAVLATIKHLFSIVQ
jgi:hypothetical protein